MRRLPAAVVVVVVMVMPVIGELLTDDEAHHGVVAYVRSSGNGAASPCRRDDLEQRVKPEQEKSYEEQHFKKIVTRGPVTRPAETADRLFVRRYAISGARALSRLHCKKCRVVALKGRKRLVERCGEMPLVAVVAQRCREQRALQRTIDVSAPAIMTDDDSVPNDETYELRSQKLRHVCIQSVNAYRSSHVPLRPGI